MRRLIFTAAALLSLCLSIPAQEHPIAPYVDPSQLDVPWPKHSHVKQPWRAFLETKSGHDFLQGIGVNLNVHDNPELAIRLLAETGFRAFRIEHGWGSVKWDESAFNGEERIRRELALCKQHGIRPTLLLNAHQGAPCPVRFFKKTLAADVPKGSRTVRFTDTREITIGRTGLSNLSDYWAAEALITAVDPATGECTLSKPLPKDLKAGEVAMAALKYAPLYPVGAPEFDETAAGWVKYALLTCKLAREAGIEDFDVEIWNELTFGTQFLRITNYFEPDNVKFEKDFLNEGGQCWELARRTVDAVKRDFPRARVIWGFSNTTFYHTPTKKMPPRTDGQSYHPYGTGTRSLPKQEIHPDKPDYNVDGFTPAIDIRMPEGVLSNFIQTECLMRRLNPKSRRETPSGTQRFYHYMTEHGVVPAECGIRDEAGGRDLKAKCALRSFCFWLNKGIDTLHYFCAYENKPQGMGIMPPDLKRLAPDAQFEAVATPPMRAIRNLTRAFEGSTPLAPDSVRQLGFEAVALGPQQKIFDAPSSRAQSALWNRDALALLPFQVNERKFVIAAYVKTYDITKPLTGERYRVTVSNLPDTIRTATLYDPLRDQRTPVALSHVSEKATADISLVDYPRLLILE